jgi:hypothetical protein
MRSLATFREPILPDLSGVIVHDRYQNYDNVDFRHLAHQLCAQHLIRDLEDAAECHPTATWPVHRSQTRRQPVRRPARRGPRPSLGPRPGTDMITSPTGRPQPATTSGTGWSPTEPDPTRYARSSTFTQHQYP